MYLLALLALLVGGRTFRRCECCGGEGLSLTTYKESDSSGHIRHYSTCAACQAGCTSDDEGQPFHLGDPNDFPPFVMEGVMDAPEAALVAVWVWPDRVRHCAWGCMAPGERWAPDGPEVRAAHPDGERWEGCLASECHGARAFGSSTD